MTEIASIQNNQCAIAETSWSFAPPPNHPTNFAECSEPFDETQYAEYLRITKPSSLRKPKPKEKITGDDLALGTIIMGGGFLLGGPIGALGAGALFLAGCYGVDGVNEAEERPTTTITDNFNHFSRISLVWNGEDYGIFWIGKDERRNNQIYYSRINQQGNKEGENVQVSSFQNARTIKEPLLVWNESSEEYGLFWLEEDDPKGIYFNKIDKDGNNKGSVVRIIEGSVERTTAFIDDFSATWNPRDSEYGVMASSNGARGIKRFACIDDVGNIRGESTQSEDDEGVEYTFPHSPSIVWNGEKYGVTWALYSPPGIRFLEVDRGCNQLGETKTITVDEEEEVSNSYLAWTGSDYGFFWSQGRYDSIQFARLDRSGNRMVEDLTVIRNQALWDVPTDYSAILSDPEGYGIAWVDEDYNYQYIKFDRLNSDGSSRDVPVYIATQERTHNAYTLPPPVFYHPSLAWTGADFGIAWSQYLSGREGWELRFAVVTEDATR